jgi:hypothetical protein
MRRRQRWGIVAAAGATTLATTLLAGAQPAKADSQAVASCDRAGVQAAIDAGGSWSLDACSGMTISAANDPLVVNGTTVTLTHDPSMSFPIFNFTSTTGPGSVFQVQSGNLTLENLTVTGVLNATDPALPAQGGGIYVAAGAHLTLNDVGVIHSQANGAPGVNGVDGTADSVDGTNGGSTDSAAQGAGLYNAGTTTITSSTFDNNRAVGGYAGDGGNGHRGANASIVGAPGAPGGSGGDAGAHGAVGQGGAIYNVGTLTVESSTISNSGVTGGFGGFAGDAADGGIGGFGADGANGVDGTFDSPQGTDGTPGGAGGQGGAGGLHAGVPGAAAEGDGGGIYNAGTAAIDHVTFTANGVTGGPGGYGGSASAPNRGGGGGFGGSGGSSSGVTGPGLAGGNGADGGPTGLTGIGGAAGADGGPGAAAHGAAIYDATGDIRIAASTFSGDVADGGWGGNAGDASQPDDGGYFYGPGGQGGSAGSGGQSFTAGGGSAGIAGKGGDGVNPGPGYAAGTGGNGGTASGLSIYTVGGALVGCGTTLDTDKTHLLGGFYGFGGNKGRGVTGSSGGKGGGKGFGGAGKPYGKRGKPGAHGFNGLRTNVFEPPGKPGHRGTVGPVAIDGAHAALGCDSVSPKSLAIQGAVGASPTGTATIHNHGSVPVTVSQVAIVGAPSNILSASGCASGAPVGGSCDITVTFHPQDSTPVHATLQITDNTVFGTQTVPIVATGTGGPPPADPSVLTAGSAATINIGASKQLNTVLSDKTTGDPVGGVSLTLGSRPAGTTGAFATVATPTTTASGQASATVHPTANTTYKWQFAGNPSHRAVASPQQTVNVAQVVTAALTKSKVKHGHHVKLWGQVAPDETGRSVALQSKSGSTWKSVDFATLVKQKLPDGKTAVGYVFKIKARGKGKHVYRAHRNATPQNAAGDSAPVHLKVK